MLVGEAAQNHRREDRDVPERPATGPADRRLLGERVQLNAERICLISNLVDVDLLGAGHVTFSPFTPPELYGAGRGIDSAFDKHGCFAVSVRSNKPAKGQPSAGSIPEL
jgi:hypothetical protein